MTNDFIIILHLSLLDGIGPATIKTIGDAKPSHVAWQDLYAWTIADFRNICGLSDAVARKIVQGLSNRDELVREQERIAKANVSCITILDDCYPALLKNIYCPPAVLYVQGEPQFHDKSLAVVGSRQATPYAARAIQKIVPLLIAHDWTIVSGGALGVDTMAHKTTLDHQGRTIVVLGSGLLRPYPPQNKKLFEHVVAAGGMLVSSFSMTTSPHPGNFPARNRIIAGLSRGCLIVQAAEKSGARITAEYALEQGREVFAIPGMIDDALSAGCHALIKQGAKLVHEANDILEEFGEQQAPLSLGEEKIFKNSVSINTQHDTSVKGSVLQLCAQPHTFDELLDVIQESPAVLQEVLFDLQLEGAILQDFTGRWCSR